MKKTILYILIGIIFVACLGGAIWLIYRQVSVPEPATSRDQGNKRRISTETIKNGQESIANGDSSATADPTATAAETIEDTVFSFPSPGDEINWEDREIFRSGLNASAQTYLEGLPEASTYYISLDIPNDIVSGIQGHQVVRYFNTEEVDLDQLYFRLYPNYQGGNLQVQNLTVNNQPVQTTLESGDTSLKVTLNTPLQPGEFAVIELDFNLIVPTEMGGNYGLLGYFENVLVLDTFYPMIPAYDQDGWYSQNPQSNGDLTYQDASFYLFQVQAPADLVLASSGVSVDRQQTAGRQTVVFAAGPARDFYLAGSREYVALEETRDDLTIRVLTLPEYTLHQQYALDYAADAISSFSERIGDYPYTEFEIISSPMLALGIEYPGITSVEVDVFLADTDLYGIPTSVLLESTIAHEAAHMWFYNTVGNDQGNQPWMDEGLAQYLTYIYYLDRYANGDGYIDSWNSRWSGVEYADIPVGMPAGAYTGPEYSAIIYGRAPLFYLELEKQYGIEMVFDAIRDYYHTNLWETGDTEDIRNSLEKACGCDLSSEFDEWVYIEE